MLLQELSNKNLIQGIPQFVTNDTQYLVLMGSVAYGCSEDSSDMDIYGWCIPPKEYIFPHLAGYVNGFGKKPPNFENWQMHHIEDKEKNKTYDISIYNIVKYFQLVMENNPNMIDSLFVPTNLVLFQTHIAEMLRKNRHLFLHKGAWHKFKGYAYSQINKCKTIDTETELFTLLEVEEQWNIPHESNLEEGVAIMKRNNAPQAVINFYTTEYNSVLLKKKRSINTKLYGYDTKFAYHVVRLISEVVEILTDHTLTLNKYDRREMLKDIRRGNWSFQQIKDWFRNKETELDKLYLSSTLRHSPDEEQIKQLLLNILETNYGSLEKDIVLSNEIVLQTALRDISETIFKYKNYMY